MEDKIAEMQAKYNRANQDGLTSLQKLKLRNHIQAQKSRMRKYDRNAQQEEEIIEKNEKAKLFMAILHEELAQSSQDHKDKVYSSLRLLKRTSNQSAHEGESGDSAKIQKTSSNQSSSIEQILQNMLIPQESKKM